MDGNEGAVAVLIVIQDNQIVVHNGGGAEAVAAFDGAEVALPELFAGVGKCGELEALRSAPGKINAIGISCGGAGGKAVFLVVPMMLGGVIERPQDLAGMGVDCDGAAGTGFFIGAQEKDVVAPNNGRSVSGGR